MGGSGWADPDGGDPESPIRMAIRMAIRMGTST